MDSAVICVSAKTLRGMKSLKVRNREGKEREFGYNSAKFLIGKDEPGRIVMLVETTTDDRQMLQKNTIRPVACGGTLAYNLNGQLQFWGDSINYGGISPQTLRRFLKFFGPQLEAMFPGAEILCETKTTPDGEVKAAKLLEELEAELTVT